MTTTTRPSSAGLTTFLGTTVGLFIFLMVSVVIVTFILPEAFVSKARVNVTNPAPGNVNPAQLKSAAGRPIDDTAFVPTECEIINSELVLDRVIEALNLNTLWAKKYNVEHPFRTSDTRMALRRMVEARPAPKTTVITIAVYSDDKNEAARIANAIAESYQTYRREMTASLLAKGEAVSLPAVQIIEHAVPGDRPVRPNKPLNLVLGFILSAVVSVLVGVVAGWIVRQFRQKPAPVPVSKMPVA